MKATQFRKNFPALHMEDFQNIFILVFMLKSVEQLNYPKFSEQHEIGNVFPVSLGPSNGSDSLGTRTSKRSN